MLGCRKASTAAMSCCGAVTVCQARDTMYSEGSAVRCACVAVRKPQPPCSQAAV